MLVCGGANIDTTLASNTQVPRFSAFRDSGYAKILILSAKANGGSIPNGGNYTPTEKERETMMPRKRFL